MSSNLERDTAMQSVPITSMEEVEANIAELVDNKSERFSPYLGSIMIPAIVLYYRRVEEQVRDLRTEDDPHEREAIRDGIELGLELAAIDLLSGKDSAASAEGVTRFAPPLDKFSSFPVPVGVRFAYRTKDIVQEALGDPVGAEGLRLYAEGNSGDA